MAPPILPDNDAVLFAAIGLNQQMLPVFWYLLLAAAIAWFFLSFRLYAELRQNHPELYEKLGSPELFKHKKFLTNIKIIKFIFAAKQGTTVAAPVKRLCQGLRALIYIYMVCLAGSLLLIFAKTG